MHAHDLNPDVVQRWRLISPTSGREVVLKAVPGVRYVDRDTGQAMEVTGRLLPLAPSPSRLPWTEENRRLCPYRDQLVPKDLNFCSHDGCPPPPLSRPSGREPDAEAT